MDMVSSQKADKTPGSMFSCGWSCYYGEKDIEALKREAMKSWA